MNICILQGDKGDIGVEGKSGGQGPQVKIISSTRVKTHKL
jgi:hypothetical protein